MFPEEFEQDQRKEQEDELRRKMADEAKRRQQQEHKEIWVLKTGKKGGGDKSKVGQPPPEASGDVPKKQKQQWQRGRSPTKTPRSHQKPAPLRKPVQEKG